MFANRGQSVVEYMVLFAIIAVLTLTLSGLSNFRSRVKDAGRNAFVGATEKIGLVK